MSKVKIGALIRVTPGKRHGWYESSLGFPVRKPLGGDFQVLSPELFAAAVEALKKAPVSPLVEKKKGWFTRAWQWILLQFGLEEVD